MNVIILSRSDDPHVKFLQLLLLKRGVDFICLNTDEIYTFGGLTYCSKQEQFTLSIGDKEVSCADVVSIWNRRPQTSKISSSITDVGVRAFCERESDAGLFGFLHSLGATWVNHPEKNALTRHKVLQMHQAKKFGFRVPHTCVSNNPVDVAEFFLRIKKELSINH